VDKISRRKFFHGSALAAAGAGATTSTKPTAATTAPKREIKVPRLDEMVAMGCLLSLQECTHAIPGRMSIMDSIARLGSTTHPECQDVWDHWGLAGHKDRTLCWYGSDEVMQPGIAESWEVNDDASEWTFHIRQGLKCSDGSPLDSDSFKWSWENRYLNQTLTTSPPGNLSTGDPKVMGEMTFPDQYTFKIRYQEPKPMLLSSLGLWRHFWTPDAYMEQFHEDFAEKGELEKLIAEAGFETWDQLFDDRFYGYLDFEKPEGTPRSADSAHPEEPSMIERGPHLCSAEPIDEALPEGHWIWEIQELWDQIAVEPDEDKRDKLFKGIVDIWAEELPHLDYLRESPSGVSVKNGFSPNHSARDQYLLNTETCFWDDPDVHS
jgi:ABC-type transport system substrate-binding protein